MNTIPEDDAEGVEEKRTEKSKETLHPKEDLTHGDEGVDDPALTPEDATEVVTNMDGEPVDAMNVSER